MKNKIFEKIANIYREKILNKKLHKIFVGLAAVVVFITSYALILPAITIEKNKAIDNNIPIDNDNYVSESLQLDDVNKDTPDEDEKPSEDFQLKPYDYEEKKLEEDLNKKIEDNKEEKKIEDNKNIDFNEESEELTKEYIEEEKEQNDILIKRDIDFSYNNGKIFGKVKVLNSLLPENAVLKISPIENKNIEDGDVYNKLNYFSYKDYLLDKDDNRIINNSTIFEQIKLNAEKDDALFREFDFNKDSEFIKKINQIEDKIDGKVEEVLLFDISFYTSEGEYLPVSEDATINFSLEDYSMSKSSEEEILVAHFDKDGLKILPTEVQLDNEDKVEEVVFNTKGFSVFAIIKQSSWTEVRLPHDEYTIITPSSANEIKTMSLTNDGLVGLNLNLDDVVARNGGLNTERPFEFKNLDNRDYYTSFAINKNTDNTYTIQNKINRWYLSFAGGDISYSSTPTKFKLFENAKYPGKVRIQSAESLGDKPLILVYNSSNNKYEVRQTYDIDENIDYSYHQFIKNRIGSVYKKLSTQDLNNMPESAEYIIVSEKAKTAGVYRSLSSNLVDSKYTSLSRYHFDSVLLNKQNDKYYLEYDPQRSNRYAEPSDWKFEKVEVEANTFYIKDDFGNYLKTISNPAITGSNNGALSLVNKQEVTLQRLKTDEFKFNMKIYTNGEVELINKAQVSGRNYGINLDSRDDTSWQAWPTTTNNRVFLAKEDDSSFKDLGQNEDKLVEAIVPDGNYIIANENASNIISRRYTPYNLPAFSSKDVNGEIMNGKGNYFIGADMFNFKRMPDGSYRITSTTLEGLSETLQLTNLDTGNNEFKRLGFGSTKIMKDSDILKISTTEDNPDLFYIYSQFGSLQLFNSIWASKVGNLGEPLRLYRVTDRDRAYNTRFTHQENMPTEKLADISNGKYTIGNSPNIQDDFYNPEDSNHQEFVDRQVYNSLQYNFTKGDGWLHFNEKTENDNTKHHTVESADENFDLSEWEFIQSGDPGHYYIKNNNGNYLSLADGKLQLTSTETKLSIYKNDLKYDQIIITQGNYRLRYDNGWKVVTTYTPLNNSDYHYLGAKIIDNLNFKLTNPDENHANNWLNNVRLNERVWAEDLDNSLANNIPKGYYEELGPIGRAFNKQNAGVKNPYTNLYRMSQSLDNLPTYINDEALKDHFKEYGLLGWEIEIDGKTYLIDKDSDFTEMTKKIDGTDVSGIVVKKENVTIDYIKAEEDLFIPFNNESPLTTKWLELSSPLYFYFNFGKGIMDVERGISSSEALQREKNVTITPVLAYGRVFFGQELDLNHDNTSVITMDYNIKNKIKSNNSLQFPNELSDLLNEDIENQLVFNYISSIPTTNENINNEVLFYEPNLPVTSDFIKEQGIGWVRETNNVLGIVKKSIENDADIIFEPDKRNITTDNYKIDYINLNKTNNGNFLQGIVYAKTAELIVEKAFKNLTPDELEKIRQPHETSYGTFENFHVDIMVDENRSNGDRSRVYDDILYKLSFNRTESGNTIATRYPKVGDMPIAYSSIERVKTIYEPSQYKVKWVVRAFQDEQFTLHEKGVNIKDDTRTLYSRIEEYKYGVDRPLEVKRSLDANQIEELKNIKSDVLTLGEYNYVRFNNLYTNGGVVLIKKYDKDTLQRVKGIKFALYKLEDDDEILIGSNLTSENGTVAFRDLKEGRYRLKEILPENSIYNELENIDFEMVKIQDAQKTYYTIKEAINKPQEFIIKPSELLDGQVTTNYIEIYNTNKNKNLVIEKNFQDILYTEYQEVLPNFKVIVFGEKDGVVYSKELNYENASSSTYSQKIIWKLDYLEAEDSTTKISPFELDEIQIREENYEHNNYPVVKRKAYFNGVQKNLIEYPFIIKKDELNQDEDASNTFKIQNLYTDTFEVVIQVYGRDKNYNHNRAISDMEFEIYGDADESKTDTMGREFENLGILYRLDKPYKEGGDLQRAFTTDSKGQTRILNLVYYKGSRYVIRQSKNPGDIEGQEDVIYYGIERPFFINLKEVDGELVPVVSPNDSVKGRMETSYQGGMLIIDINLDRTNYKLPETGGVGINFVHKVAMGIIILSAALLYKNYYLFKKGEK